MTHQSTQPVQAPTSHTLVRRALRHVTREQREYVLLKSEYNVFAFPSDLLVLDFLSDSGTTAMFDTQWAALMLGDEAYGRNRGYYVLLDAIRDTFERGDSPRRLLDLARCGETDTARMIDEVYAAQSEGGFVNGGAFQLARPNAFLCPQGRCAEYLLFSTLGQVIREQGGGERWIPNNGHFDTTEANVSLGGLTPVNFFSDDIFRHPTPLDREPAQRFAGDMDVGRLEQLIREKGADRIPVIYLTVTNNTVAGQPVSLANIRAVHAVAERHGIPLFLDACRFAENAIFIKLNEQGCAQRSVRSIVQEMFSHADGFTISFKKDGMANIGGGLFFRDRGVFHQRFSRGGDIGVRIKEKQICTFGNDSYGGLSGRDIMSVASGLYEVVKEPYLRERIGQVRYFAEGLAAAGVPVVRPAGGHAVYIDIDRFFDGMEMKAEDFGGVGLTIELIREYGIRGCELGPFAFEADQRTEEQRRKILNLVRFAVPRNLYDTGHIDYAISAIADLHRRRQSIPKVRITRGATLKLRHFQSGLSPEYGVEGSSTARKRVS